MEKPAISIVIPVFNEVDNIRPLHSALVKVLETHGSPYEIIFSDNRSTDGTVAEILKLPRTTVLQLARNYGQTSNLDAGMRAAKGDIIITMDGDLQNDPADIPALIVKIHEGYDVVSGWRQSREDSFDRRILSSVANWLTGRVTGLRLQDSACALKAYRREVLQHVHLYGEMHVFLPACLYMQGARVAEIPVRHHARRTGFSKHHFFKAVKNLADLITIKFLGGMGGRPLLLFGGIGLMSFSLGFVSAVAALYLKIAHIRNLGETPLLLLAVLFALSGLIFFMMGLLAELMLRIYFETSGRKPYIVRTVTVTE